ncbi:DUF3363 domain-containing protein [Pandoraea cepalis]|nr:DUF3363 domain-containing protein [Pandoraea cepalis]
MVISETLDRWQDADDKHMFKVMVSPEFGDRLDLRAHIRQLMAKMEADMGTKLQWVAVDHYNTDDPHVHIAIRGVDDRGRVLEVDPSYIKMGSRARAQELATQTLGFRTERDVSEALERQVAQQRFTDLDRAILRRAHENVVDFQTEIPKSRSARESRIRYMRRLTALTEMGLAQKTGSHSWTLSQEIESALRARQIAEDRLKTKFLHRETISDPRAQIITTELKSVGQRVGGRLVGTGVNEQTGRAYLLLEGFDGKVHYVHQSAAVERRRNKGELRAGDHVVLTVAARRDDDGKLAGAFTRVENFGQEIGPDLLDKEIFHGGTAVEAPLARDTFARRFRAELAKRQDVLRQAGALVEDATGKLVPGLRDGHDRVRFQDAGISAPNYRHTRSNVHAVVAKGHRNLVLESPHGERSIVSSEQLESLGIDFKYVQTGRMLFLAKSQDPRRRLSMMVDFDKLEAMPNDTALNRLDTLAQELPQLPATHPLKSLIDARTQAWRERGIDLHAPDFVRDAVQWSKNDDLARVSDINPLVEAQSLNRLDWLMQQPFAAANAPLGEAISARAKVWLSRGVDPRDSRFAMLASVWKKGEERRLAAETRGAEIVLEELGKELGKPTRKLECEPGRQISGRVVFVAQQRDHVAVVVDTGGELTLVNQPKGQDLGNIRAGMRVKAQAQIDVAHKEGQRVRFWRFADMERQRVMSKDKAKGRDLF